MKSLSREQVLAMILPAFALGVFYFLASVVSLGKGINPSGEVPRVYEQIARLKGRTPSQSSIRLQTAEVAALSREVAQKTKHKKELDQQFGKLVTAYTRPCPWPESIRLKITLLLKKNGLREIVSENGNKPQLPTSLRNALSNLKKAGSEKNRRQTVTYRFKGNYQELLRGLKALESEKIQAFPISLTMEEANIQGNEREWTLKVWF